METFHTEKTVTQILKPCMLNGDSDFTILLYFLNLESRKSIRKGIRFIFKKGANVFLWHRITKLSLYDFSRRMCIKSIQSKL